MISDFPSLNNIILTEPQENKSKNWLNIIKTDIEKPFINKTSINKNLQNSNNSNNSNNSSNNSSNSSVGSTIMTSRISC